MCVCVFWRSLCSKFFRLRDYFERFFMLIGSLVELYVGLHSYLCFSPLEKLFWKASSTPPRYLAICRASQPIFLTQSQHLLDTWWIDRESSCLLDSSLTPHGSIKLLFLNLILCCSIPQLSTTSSSTPTSTPTSTTSSTPLDTSAVEHYWKVYIYFHRDPSLIFSISLDLSVIVHPPNNLFFTLNLFLRASSSFFKFFYTW